jgi:ornithine cyclodeaminase/alanine dehydrogenase-like protein (mu-crystallin family)
LTEADVEALLTPADAVEAVEGSFRRLAEGVVANRPRYRVPVEGASLQVMSAVDEELRLAGVKAYAATTGGISYVVPLFDLDQGALVAVIEADRLGQLRTGAASAVAAKYLAREGATSLGIIGCGWQAESQVRCIREAVPAIERVVAYCRTEKALKSFCRRLKAEPAENHREAAEQDVVVTATTSKDPVLRGEWLEPGALVCAMGANHRRRRELDNAVLERSSFVCVDSREQAKLESGDLIEPIEQGILDWLEVHELQEVVGGEVQGRQSADDIVLFKSNGIAAWDLAVAARVVELAREQGKGTEV